MAKNWYPVIDYTLCVECGNCTDKCKRGVYDKEKVSTGFVQKLSGNPKYVKFSTVLKIVMGTIILLIGFYMFYLGFLKIKGGFFNEFIW